MRKRFKRFELYKTMIRDNTLIKVFIVEGRKDSSSVYVRPARFSSYNHILEANEALGLYVPPHLMEESNTRRALDIFLDREENWIFKLLGEEKESSYEHLSYTQELMDIFLQEVSEITGRLQRELSALHNVEIKLSKLVVQDPTHNSWKPGATFTFGYVDTDSKEQKDREIIHLSTDLINTPKYALESVIYHELCHLVQFAQEGDTNHDENFYKLADLDPNYEKCSDWMQEHDTEFFPDPANLGISTNEEGNEIMTNFIWI